jgi:sulfoxide reductase heme-binding subunit YedZ
MSQTSSFSSGVAFAPESLRLWLFMSLFASAVIASWSMGENSDLSAWQLWARYTARISFPFFLLAYAARPLHMILAQPWTAWLRKNRRNIGLSFALLHIIHLGALVMFFVTSGEPVTLVTIIGGGLGYLFIVLMALTSSDKMIKRIGPITWRRLHLVGMHYLAFIFLLSYLGRSFEPDNLIFLTHVVAILGVIALRARLLFKMRNI